MSWHRKFLCLGQIYSCHDEELPKAILACFQQFRDLEEKSKVVIILAPTVGVAGTLEGREPKFKIQVTAAYDLITPEVESDVPVAGRA